VLPADNEWAVQVRQVTKGSPRATRVDVLVEEGRHQRRLTDVTAIIQDARLPPEVRHRAISIFRRLAEAEAKVHGITHATSGLHRCR
jgi:uncharacterized protein (DUF111 family)